MNESTTHFSIKELFSGNAKYVIPFYQRNYAWEEGEITQLIQDIIDYLPENKNYYIGTLVVHERPQAENTPNSTPAIFETIDGQQRLTTLSLLTAYLNKNKELNITKCDAINIFFDGREHSTATLAAIFEVDIKNDPTEKLDENQINIGILNGYRLIKKILPGKLNEKAITLQRFSDFLIHNVKIMRVKVPSDTERNHYFEIMNSRGEQLEKSEVLKAQMLNLLNEPGKTESEIQQNRHCLHTVWEACANMERYVQMGFTPKHRATIFSDEDAGILKADSFETLRDVLCEVLCDGLSDALRPTAEVVAAECTAKTFDEILKNSPVTKKAAERENNSPERFSSIINFPNFLLHALRVQMQKDMLLENIPLDDKKLLLAFKEQILDKPDATERVKQFTFILLRCKYLLDHYVIKREYLKDTDRWSLQRFKLNDGDNSNASASGSYVNTFGQEDGQGGVNRQIIMMLSAFHVSAPTPAYKNWLNAALLFLFNAQKMEAVAYLQHMESVAKAFVFDRFLAPDVGTDYIDIIYKNGGICQTKHLCLTGNALQPRLTYECIANNLVFNFLDYLLWVQHRTSEPIKSYEFTFRSSVEHYYPQNPSGSNKKLEPQALNSFGNLCLISHEKNSRLSNRLPEEKKGFYQENSPDSVKQYLMMQFEPWDEKAIDEHGKAMVAVLIDCLDEAPHC